MTKWIDASREKPPIGELIWVWDNEKREKFVVRYLGDKTTWEMNLNNLNFPMWALIKEKDE